MAARFGGRKTFWSLNAFLCFLLLSQSLIIAEQDMKDDSYRQNLKIQELLKKLNRPSFKSIKSPDGDIIDCVHISDQPAFSDPKLKNHQIQTKSSFHPQGEMLKESKVLTSKSKPLISQLWRQRGSCPKGTIPMRRIRKEDILRANSIKQYGKKNQKSIPQFQSLQTQAPSQFAAVYVDGDKYYGGKATMSVWNPQVQEHNEFSNSKVWLQNGDTSNYDAIHAGWQVNPELYGDNNTRLFTFWTADAGQDTGCYDLLCSGFVQVNNNIALGGAIKPLSVFNDNNSQYDITVLIWKDPENGDWWMSYGNDTYVGYWPASLFSRLSESATKIMWGGEVMNSGSNGQHTTTQMGSGHFPEEGFGKASFFKQIRIVDNKNQEIAPPNNIHSFTDQSNCYNIQLGSSNDWGTYLYFGGPGRNPNCP